jgi:tetratricopeptide (TPR) repeat protein
VPTFAPKASAPADPWASLRRALGRGQLQESVALQHHLAAAADPSRAGSEPIEGDGLERAVRSLLEGIGSALAGDGPGGRRILEPLARPTQPNLSFRWLALLWSARAAMRSGSVPAARAQIQEALTAARQLDIEARALSQWIAAEVLAQDGDPTRALAWLAESRSRFEKVGDRWGMGQTWLSEARVLTSTKREKEASEAAVQAAALDPDSEEPQVVLARLSLIRDDLPAAERGLLPLKSQAAERVRALIAAIKGSAISRHDASEFLREQEAPPSERALRSLERIASAAPRFAPAREALAWMLLRLGRYDDAGAVFRGLLSLALPPGDRASVMLGLGCIATAQGTGAGAPAELRDVVAAGTAPAATAGGPDVLPPLPALSTSAMLSRTAQSPGAGAVFSGQLSSFALPDLLEFLRSGKRTGLLVCSSASGMGALRFRDGWVTGAASPSTPGIGQVLVLTRKIRPEELTQVTAALGDDLADAVVGERLVADGVADAGAVRAGFERQIRFAVRELMLWTEGEFTFNREADGPSESPALAVSLDPQGLLLNFFKEMDEASRNAPSP